MVGFANAVCVRSWSQKAIPTMRLRVAFESVDKGNLGCRHQTVESGETSTSKCRVWNRYGIL